jgi:hypothetical protein
LTTKAFFRKCQISREATVPATNYAPFPNEPRPLFSRDDFGERSPKLQAAFNRYVFDLFSRQLRKRTVHPEDFTAWYGHMLRELGAAVLVFTLAQKFGLAQQRACEIVSDALMRSGKTGIHVAQAAEGHAELTRSLKLIS